MVLGGHILGSRTLAVFLKLTSVMKILSFLPCLMRQPECHSLYFFRSSLSPMGTSPPTFLALRPRSPAAHCHCPVQDAALSTFYLGPINPLEKKLREAL